MTAGLQVSSVPSRSSRRLGGREDEEAMSTHLLKILLAAIVLALAIASPVLAQNTPAKVEQYSRGAKKMKVGAVLMGAGVFFVVTTPGSEKFVVPAAFGTGMGLVMWGARERADAMKPQTGFGVRVGGSKGLYFSRRW